MSDANRVRISYIEESTYGVTPSGALNTLRYTGESLQQATDTTVSQEIRADRQTGDFIRTGLRANGDLNFELSYGTYNGLFKSALFSGALSSTITQTVSVQVTVTNASGIVTLARASGDWTAGGAGVAITSAEVGRWVRITGLTLNPNQTAKVVSVSALNLVVSHSNDMVNEVDADGCVVVVLGAYLAGTTTTSWSIERYYEDLTNEYVAWTGMLPNTLSLNGTPNGIITGSASFIGKRETSATSTIGTSYTPSYATVTPVMNGIDNMELCSEGGVTLPLYSFNFTLNNNLRERLQMGTLGAISVATGQINISGQLVTYFTSQTLANKYLNFTATNVALKFKDSSGNRIILDIPRMKYSTGPRPAPGINQDVFLTLGFQGYLHPTQLQSLRIAMHDGP